MKGFGNKSCGISEDEVHVWYLDTSVDLDFMDCLSKEEYNRANSYRFEKDREEFMLTRMALRTLLGVYLSECPSDISLKKGVYGKPYLKGPGQLFFNVSHSVNQSVLAFSTYGEVGVDVEYVRKGVDPRNMAERYFTKEEFEDVIKLPGECGKVFFRYWVRKESYLKATGMGLNKEMNSFSVLGDEKKVVKLGNWWVQDLNCSSHYLSALCVGRQHPAPRVREFLLDEKMSLSQMNLTSQFCAQ